MLKKRGSNQRIKTQRLTYLISHRDEHAEVAKHELHGVEKAHREDLRQGRQSLHVCAHEASQIGQKLREDAQQEHTHTGRRELAYNSVRRNEKCDFVKNNRQFIKFN